MRHNSGERHHGSLSQEVITTFQTWLVSPEMYIYVPKIMLYTSIPTLT